MLAKTAGVKYLVVLVNKMDDPTVNWDEARWVFYSLTLFKHIKISCSFQVQRMQRQNPSVPQKAWLQFE